MKMTAAQAIDIDALLAPVSEELPGGTDPRADDSANSLYYQVKDARNAARARERSAVEADSVSPEEWDTVVTAASELLSQGGKDFEVAAWLVEALVRTAGLGGLRDGLAVIVGIANDFWDSSFPELDEDGIEGKLAAVAALSGVGAPGTLAQPLRLLPLTHGTLASHSLWSYEQASELQKITDEERLQARVDAGAVTMEQFTRSVDETPASDLALTASLVTDCEQALAAMSAAFDAIAPAEAPSVSGLRDLLAQIGSAIRYFAADKLTLASDEMAVEGSVEEPIGTPDDTAAVDAAPTRRVGGYVSREQALAELLRIAAYFRRTEPHSPISYTLQEASRRARMSLPELLTELADDPTYVQQMLRAAGIGEIASSDDSDGDWGSEDEEAVE